jgi:hypothetical protein
LRDCCACASSGQISGTTAATLRIVKEFPPAHVRPLAQETASYQFNRVL